MKSVSFFIFFLLTFQFSNVVIAQTVEDARQVDSTEVNSLYQNALNNLKSGDFYTAQNQLEQAVALDSTHQDANLNLMRIYYVPLNFDRAHAIAFRLTSIPPRREEHWIALAHTYLAPEHFVELTSVYDTLTKLNPNESSHHYDHASTLSLNGQTED